MRRIRSIRTPSARAGHTKGTPAKILGWHLVFGVLIQSVVICFHGLWQHTVVGHVFCCYFRLRRLLSRGVAPLLLLLLLAGRYIDETCSMSTRHSKTKFW